MANVTRLQGIGLVEGIPAKDLKVGDITVWNYGGTEEITSIEFSKTGKTLKVGIKYFSSMKEEWVNSERKFKADRIVVIK